MSPSRAGAALAAAAILAAGAARAQTAYVVTDVETLDQLTFDTTVTCPLASGSYVSGSNEGCPTGRAPSVGECGLDYTCGIGLPVPDALLLADHFWAQLVVQPIVLDMGVPTETAWVFNAADHLPFPEEGVEWTVWGRDSPDVTGFPAGWTLATLCAIFKQGWVESGACPGDDADDFTGMFAWTQPFRYVAVYSNYSITIFLDAAHTTWSTAADDHADPGWQSSEAELDAVARPAAPGPVAIAGPDPTACVNQPVTLDAGGSTGAILRYSWDTDGDGAIDATGPTVTLSFPAPGVYTVSLFVIGECGCDADTVEVTVVDCPLAVRFERYGATTLAEPGPRRVAVEWSTLEEEGTNYFLVERAESAAGAFAPVGEPVAALGPGVPYRRIDPGAPAGTPWYRVVELTSAGRGDATPPFAARASARAPSGLGRRRAGRGR